MKKNILVVMMVVSMLLGTVASKRSEAAVGLIVAAPVVITVGAIAAGAGVLTTGGSWLYIDNCSGDWCGIGALMLSFVGIGVGIVGLVILDDQSHGADFQALDADAAAKLGVTAEQAEAYNTELDEINAAKQTVVAEVAQMKKPSIEKAKALWQNMRQNISPEAYAVMEKVSVEFVKNTQK